MLKITHFAFRGKKKLFLVLKDMKVSQWWQKFISNSSFKHFVSFSFNVKARMRITTKLQRNKMHVAFPSDNGWSFLGIAETDFRL